MEKYTCGLCKQLIEVLNEKFHNQAESHELLTVVHKLTAGGIRWRVIIKYEKEYVREYTIIWILNKKMKRHLSLFWLQQHSIWKSLKRSIKVYDTTMDMAFCRS